MGIEPTTYSLGSTRVSNNIKRLAAKLRLLRLNGVNGLPSNANRRERREASRPSGPAQ